MRIRRKSKQNIRKKRRYNGRASRVKAIIRKMLSKKLLYFILSIVFILATVFGVRYVFFNDKFKLKNLEIEGTNEVSIELLKDEVETLKGENIFVVRPSKIRGNLINKSSYIEEVWVEKKLPDTLVIRVKERIPHFVWINFDGAFLTGSDGFILEKVADFSGLSLSAEEKDILKGYADVEAIKESINEEKDNDTENSLGEDTDETVIDSEDEAIVQEGGELEEIDVLEEVENLENEVQSKVEAYWNSNLKDLDILKEDYAIFYSYDDTDFNIASFIPKTQLDFLVKMMTVDFGEYNVERYTAESEFRYVVNLSGSRKVVFTSTRKVEIQVEELEKVLEKIIFEDLDFYIIDLSTKKTAIGLR